MSTVYNVSIHSDISEFPTEKRYDSNIKISELKKKLELITGANHSTMKVSLIVGDKDIGSMDDNDQTLGYYAGKSDTQEQSLKLVVKDEQVTDLLNGDVPKYTISEEKYLERKNTARSFIKELREKRLSGEQ